MNTTLVKDIMQQNVSSIETGSKITVAVNIMVQRHIGSLIVCNNGNPVGIITKKDLLHKILANCQNPCEITVDKVFNPSLITITPDETVYDALQKMFQNKIKRLPVIDSNNKLKGIISIHDILATFRPNFLIKSQSKQLTITKIPQKENE